MPLTEPAYSRDRQPRDLNLGRRRPRLMLIDFGRRIKDFGRCRLYVTNFGGGGYDSGGQDLSRVQTQLIMKT